MIVSFTDKALEDSYQMGNSRKLPPKLKNRILMKLQSLDLATHIKDLESPAGNRLHRLKGDRKKEWVIAINGSWRLVFEFEDGNAYNVALEQYH